MKLRIARHTDNLDKIKSFYCDILGLKIIGRFENHDGYDGVFIGRPNESWHLEFTSSEAEATHQTDEDDLIVLYPESRSEYDNLIQKLALSKIEFICAKNPYWNSFGKMILDPDGFRIVISNQKATS
ncbi:MAG: VOC family protein [Flavobacterium sp.]|nr:MAG: VOC family protein [Flavobacterium sp.]